MIDLYQFYVLGDYKDITIGIKARNETRSFLENINKRKHVKSYFSSNIKEPLNVLSPLIYVDFPLGGPEDVLKISWMRTRVPPATSRNI